MGIVFGVIGVERPAFEVLETFQEYDVRHFTQEMVKAEVRFDPTSVSAGIHFHRLRATVQFSTVALLRNTCNLTPFPFLRSLFDPFHPSFFKKDIVIRLWRKEGV